MKVGVINYGVGNLGSVLGALDALDVSPIIVNNPLEMHLTDCLILPGVGNFADCSRLLSSGGWIDAIRDEVLTHNRPILGICVGMQLLANDSMEGASNGESVPGIGLIPGHVKHLRDFGCNLRVPHIGWNEVVCVREGDLLLSGIPSGTDFYFVHSYAFEPIDRSDLLATTDYGVPITAAVRRGHIWGTQFHPEKSSRAGFRLLKNYIESCVC
jgi:glutamine amidotransferase